MNEKELREILHSDMKLWDQAETTEDGGTVTKVLDLPYGIGRTEVTLEGLTDGTKRRGAIQGFGDYIRGVIDNKVGEESVTARAVQAAARVSAESDKDVVGGEPLRVSNPKTEDGEDAMEAFDEPSRRDANPAHRLSDLLRGVVRAEAFIASASKEIEALTAYEEIMNASADKETPPDDPAAET